MITDQGDTETLFLGSGPFLNHLNPAAPFKTLKGEGLILTGDSVVGRGQCGECIYIPQEDLPVQSGRRHQLLVFRICEGFDVVLQGRNAQPFSGVPL